MTASPTESKNKLNKQSFVRTKVLFYGTCTLVIISLYTLFFFDGHLKKVLEWGLTKATSVEVNIASVKTSLVHLSFEMNGFQLTNGAQPKENLIYFESLRFHVLPDALLRAKIVIEEASLLGLSMHTKRAYAGKVYPAPPEDPNAPPSALTKAFMQERDSWVKNELSQSVLGDIFVALEAKDLKTAAKGFLENLNSEKKIAELVSFSQSKKAEWIKEVASLKNPTDLKSTLEEIKAIKPSKDPKELLEQLKKFNELQKKANAQLKNHQSAAKQILADAQHYQKSLAEVPDLVKADIKDIKGKLRIPEIDVSSMGQSVFKRLIFEYIGPYLPYVEKAKPYWESKQEYSKSQVKPPPRGQGETIHFPITTGYPLFWLKKLALSGRSNGDSLYGELNHVSTSPKIIQRPVRLLLQGAMPSKNLSGLKVNLLANTHLPVFSADADIIIGSMKQKEIMMTESSSLSVGLGEIQSSFHGKVSISKNELDVELASDLSPEKWLVKAASSSTEKLAMDVFNPIQKFDVIATAHGPWSSLGFNIKSSLINQIASSLKLALEKKVQELTVQLEGLVQEKLKNQLDHLVQQNKFLQSDVFAPLKEIDLFHGDAAKSMDLVKKNLEEKLKNQGKEKVKDELNKLKNKFKLPFNLKVV
jgi:uncharacterized protein (TIGR03545 family)